MSRLPSKKIIVLMILTLSLISYISYKKFFPTHTTTLVTPEVDQNTLQELTTDDVALLDQDKDGLPDWQERIWGTDPTNPDTDGDSTPDGAEVKSRRDPLKKGDDALEGQFTTSSSTEPESISEAVSRKIFSNTVFLSTNGTLSEENQQSIIDNVVNELQSSFTFKEYPASGLQIIDNENEKNLRFYGDVVASLQIQMMINMNKSITQIQKDISVLADIYAKQASSLYAIRVPKELADTHLQIINNFSRASAVYQAVANESKDPLKLPFAVKVYTQAVSDQESLLRNIAIFLKSNGIIFTNDEVGGYWNLF